MKILLVNNYHNYELGGVESYLQELMNYAEENSTEIIFKWFGASSKKTKWNQKFYNHKITHEIIAEIDSFQPDIIHCFSIGASVTPHFLKYAKKKSIPIIYSFRDYYYICPKTHMLSDKGIICKHNGFLDCILNHYPKKNIIYDILLYAKQWYHKQIIKKHIDYFFTPSKRLTDFIKIEFSIPGKTLSNPALLKNSDIEKKSEYLLFVGRVEKEKGIETLLKAFKNITEKHPNEYLKIVGSGSSKTILEDFVLKNNIHNVSFIGAKKRSELAELYASAKFTIIPSEVLESFGNVILESFAFGKTVIISNLLGIVDEVVSSKSGLVFPFGNAAKLEESIEKLLIDDYLREELEANTVSFVANNSFAHHFKELVSVYKEILKET